MEHHVVQTFFQSLSWCLTNTHHSILWIIISTTRFCATRIVDTSWIWHLWYSSWLAEVQPIWANPQDILAEESIQFSLPLHRCATRLCSQSSSLLHLYYVPRLHHSLTRLFLSLLCWRHMVLPVLTTRWLYHCAFLSISLTPLNMLPNCLCWHLITAMPF